MFLTCSVWDELQKSNSQFFIAYSSKLCKKGQGEEEEEEEEAQNEEEEEENTKPRQTLNSSKP